MTISKRKLKGDISYFAKVLLGIDLHPKQRELITCDSRRVVACCGRKFGKTEASIIKALHTAITKPDSRILIVSTGEREAKEVLRRLKTMTAKSEALSGIIVDENKSEAVFGNGSEVICLPNNPMTIRGYSDVRLIILDEASLLQKEIIEAVEPMGINLPDSQTILIGTPFSKEHFFHEYFTMGGKLNDKSIKSFHYPTACNPFVPQAELDWLKSNKSETLWRRDYLAEWINDQEAYFPTEIIEGCILDYPLQHYLNCNERVHTVVGIDWGRKYDQTVIIGLSMLEQFKDMTRPREPVWFVSLFKAFPPNTPWDDMIEGIERVSNDYKFAMCMSEPLGLGSQATETLKSWGKFEVKPVHTTNALKVQMFDHLYSLMVQGRLILPREPELVRQLSNLRINLTEGGQTQIRAGQDSKHDDMAMALGFAILGTREKFAYDQKYLSREVNDYEQSVKELPLIPAPARLYRALTCGDILYGQGERIDPPKELKTGRRRFPHILLTTEGCITTTFTRGGER